MIKHVWAIDMNIARRKAMIMRCVRHLSSLRRLRFDKGPDINKGRAEPLARAAKITVKISVIIGERR
jgi:hypothetical protein